MDRESFCTLTEMCISALGKMTFLMERVSTFLQVDKSMMESLNSQESKALEFTTIKMQLLFTVGLGKMI